MPGDLPMSSSPWINVSLPTNASTVSPPRFQVGTFMRMQWEYQNRALSDHVGPIALVLIHDRRATSTATSAATGRSKRDLSGISISGGRTMTADGLRGKRADLVVVIQSPKVDPEMTHFSWYIPVDACARGWCEPNILVLGFINNTELQSWTQNVLAMTSRPFFISATQDVVPQDPLGSPTSSPTISMLPSSISISSPAASRPAHETTTTRMLSSATSYPPPSLATPGGGGDTAARDHESLLGYFLVAFICFCLGSAFTLAVLSCLRRFQDSRRRRSRDSSPTESDFESSSFSTDVITGSGTHRSSEDPSSSAGKQRRGEGGAAAAAAPTSAGASAETSRASIAQLHPRGYHSVSDPGPGSSSSNRNSHCKNMARRAFYQHQVPSESWSDPGVGVATGVVPVGSKATLRAHQQTNSAIEEMPTTASTSSETHLRASTSKSTGPNTRVKSDGSIRMGFELVRVATAHSATFVRPAASGERVGAGQVRLGNGGGSVSEPALPVTVNGPSNAPSSQHIQAHLVHFSKEGQGVVVSGSHEAATTAASSAAGKVHASDSVEESSCHKPVISQDGSVATVASMCFDIVPPPSPSPRPLPPTPAVQLSESSLEIVEEKTSPTVGVSSVPLIITTPTSSLSPIPECESESESDSNINVKPMIVEPTANTVQPQQPPQQDLHDAVPSSRAGPPYLNDDIISFYLPSSPVPQRQRSLTGLPIARRHRAHPVRGDLFLDLSVTRPATPFPNASSSNGNGSGNSRSDSRRHASQWNFSLPILHSSGISESFQGEGFNVGVQHWRKPAALEEKLAHITTIEELEDYALCGETVLEDVGSPPVIRAPGSGARSQRQQPSTTDESEVGEPNCSNTGGTEGGRARQSVASLESRIEMLKEFPVPPAMVVIEAANPEKCPGDDSGSGLGL